MTKTLMAGTRILALDLHPQRYGYAVLETPMDLLDWGVKRRYRNAGGASTMQASVRSLLHFWQPSLLVIKKPTCRTARTRERLARLILEARRSHVLVHQIKEQDRRSGSCDGKQLRKYEVACGLVQKFPFLASTLPPPRKISDSEDYRMGMFAAIALAVALPAKPLPRISGNDLSSRAER